MSNTTNTATTNTTTNTTNTATPQKWTWFDYLTAEHAHPATEEEIAYAAYYFSLPKTKQKELYESGRAPLHQAQAVYLERREAAEAAADDADDAAERAAYADLFVRMTDEEAAKAVEAGLSPTLEEMAEAIVRKHKAEKAAAQAEAEAEEDETAEDAATFASIEQRAACTLFAKALITGEKPNKMEAGIIWKTAASIPLTEEQAANELEATLSGYRLPGYGAFMDAQVDRINKQKDNKQ